jgi:hypothetical protein
VLVQVIQVAGAGREQTLTLNFYFCHCYTSIYHLSQKIGFFGLFGFLKDSPSRPVRNDEILPKESAK